MVSIASLKQKVFCDTRKCLFRCWTNKLWCSTRIYFRAAPLPNIYKWLTTDIKRNWVITLCWRYPYLLSSKDVEKIEKVLNKEFPSLCEWFIDNKLSIHFWDDKTKTISFSRMKSPPKLNISYGKFLKLNFLRRKSNCLNYSSRRLLCNALIQPHFDYGCTS